MKVFIGGSRAVSRLNAVIRDRIDDVVINRGHTVVVGDANGADKAVQQYLADRQYPHVVVFCMEKCRNNIGEWATRNIEPPTGSTGFAYYSAKDLVMAQEAKCGLMLWDGKSKGTLQNMLKLIGAEKRALVYFAPTKDFHVLGNEADLHALLARCRKSDIDLATRPRTESPADANAFAVSASVNQKKKPIAVWRCTPEHAVLCALAQVSTAS